jgi:hypothetical protein
MQRTLNYTERKRIEQKQAQFSFSDKDTEVPEFDVTFNIDGSAYPENAALYVEAYHKETRQRFSFGTVVKIVPPTNRMLDQLDLSGPILFRVIVVDEAGKNGLLLASGEGFRADANEDEDNKSSILTVVSRPLHQVPWKVDFDTGGPPELCLNNTIPNAIEKMRTDSIFQSLILPAALRQVLTFYMWNEDEESEVSERWISFAALFADKPEGSDPIQTMDWIDEVVEGFAAKFDLCDRLNNELRGDD